MSVQSYKDAKGRQRYEVQFMFRGERIHQRCPPGTTKEQALRLEAKIRQERFRVSALGESPDVSLGEAIQRYLDEEVSHQKARRITTLKAYSLEPFVVGKSLSQCVLAAEELVRSLRGTSSPATINRKLSILKRVAHLAYSKWGWLQEPLHDRITKLPGEKERHTYLSKVQIEGLLRHLQTEPGRLASVIAAYTGLRQGEIWAVAAENFRANTIVLPDSKTGAPRAVPVIPKIRQAVARWIRVDRPHRRTVYKDFEQARVKIGMPGLRFHDLRHTCASLLAAEGVDLGTIGAILGHSSTQTTKRYAHLSLDAKRKALRKIG